MNFIEKFKNIFSSKKEEISVKDAAKFSVDTADTVSDVVVDDKPFSQPEPPAMRRIIKIPAVSDDIFPPKDSIKILIKAQPTVTGDQCLFMLNRSIFSGYSWWYPSFESAEGSPVAERLFSLDGIESVLINESAVTVTRKDKTMVDWKTLAGEIGASLRELLEEGGPLVFQKIIDDMPSQQKIKEGIEKAINEEVNPGVAGHGGLITLEKIKGNTITIQMGGGCQGCSAADLTLKQGIHSSFRKFVPFVGAIFDETDHAAGVNPYF